MKLALGQRLLALDRSLPLRGAWIETVTVKTIHEWVSRSPCGGRGLKLLRVLKLLLDLVAPLAGGVD